MAKLLLIFKLLLRVKFIFRNPQKHELVIFDGESSGVLKNFIYHYNSFTLQNRIHNINKVYFSFQIIKYFFKYYNGNIMLAYLVSLLEVIRPKVVLTFSDNSLKFFDIAKILDKKIIFVAIQNGARYDLKRYKHLYKVKKTNSDLSKNFYIPNFLCFGQCEIDDYKENRINVKNFFKVGSLTLANFFYHIEKNNILLKKSLYDICLISDPISLGTNDAYALPNIEKGFATTMQYTINFCMKHNMKMIFSWKRDKKKNPNIFEKELTFYKKYLTNNEFNYLVTNSVEKDEFSSYKAMFQSKVAVATYSTMLREKLGIGEKILSCNLTQTDIFDFPIDGVCSIKNCNFQEFEKRLLNIHSISKEDYFSKLSKDKCYTMEYDEKISTIEILKKKIDLLLANEPMKQKI